jgi:hypothetical protein
MQGDRSPNKRRGAQIVETLARRQRSEFFLRAFLALRDSHSLQENATRNPTRESAR